MAQYLTNSTARIGFIFLVDGEETQADSASIDVYDPSGTLIVDDGVPALKAGTVGSYTYELTSAQIAEKTGAWKAVWTLAYGSTVLTKNTWFTVGTTAEVISLRELRRSIAQRHRDLWAAVVTANGTAYQIIDTIRLHHASAFFANAWTLATRGTSDNLGLARQAMSFEGGTVELAEPYPASPSIADQFDIHRRFSPVEYREAINEALAEAYPRIYLPCVDETTVGVGGQSDYDVSGLPFPITQVGWVEIETTPLRPWMAVTASLDPDRRILRLDRNAAVGGKKIRIVYESRMGPLLNEDDVLEVEQSRLQSIKSYLHHATWGKLLELEYDQQPPAEAARLEKMLVFHQKKAEEAIKAAQMRRLTTRVQHGRFGIARDRPDSGSWLGGHTVLG
jgi:hypothetical protein